MLGMIADQATKIIVRGEMKITETRNVVSFLDFHHVQNTGIAFGLFKGAGEIVVALTALVAIGVFVWMLRSPSVSVTNAIAIAGVVGGAAGNLVDRVRLGYVTDFLEVPHWPTFNVADIFIVCGVAWIALHQVVTDLRSPETSGGNDGA